VLVLLAHVLTAGAAPAAGTPRTSTAPTSTATASTASTSTVLDPGLPSTGPAQRVIVTGSGAAAAVRAAGGRVGTDLPLVDGVSAVVPAAQLADLAATPTVTGVTADRSGSVVDFEWDVTASASTFARTVGATPSWARGTYGSGVGVAVLDTGVSPSPDLAGRIVHGPDLSGEGTVVDSYGHGTVMAGIIAGDGAASATRPGGAYTGLAPAAHVVAVKVAGRNGVVDVSTVLQAMHWVSVYRQQYGIRVLNLSWGVASTQSPAVDPLDHAVQRLWAEGIVVVVAAGNSGNGPGTITKPGDDPVVLTVGAMNDGGDLDPSNDDVPAWSSRGPTAAGAAKPDLVTPGRTLVAQRSRGSQVEADNPKALVSGDYVRGSGTSQAAAVASGAVALLLSRRPGLTPDQVKSVLMSTADPIAGTSRSAQGAGRMDLEAAMTATPSATPQVLSATGTGLIDASRGPARVIASCDGVLREIRGEIDVRCRPWDGPRWAGSSWTGSSWTGSSWTGSSWTGSSWTGSSWTDATWTGSSWTGGTWTGSSWQGSRGWTGEAAVTSPWTGSSWSGSSWTGSTWKASSTWTGAAYDELLTAFWGTTPPPGKRIRGEAFTPAGGG
jgi:serine protease AprX